MKNHTDMIKQIVPSIIGEEVQAFPRCAPIGICITGVNGILEARGDRLAVVGIDSKWRFPKEVEFDRITSIRIPEAGVLCIEFE